MNPSRISIRSNEKVQVVSVSDVLLSCPDVRLPDLLLHSRYRAKSIFDHTVFQLPERKEQDHITNLNMVADIAFADTPCERGPMGTVAKE
jgi:hypothetical protein